MKKGPIIGASLILITFVILLILIGGFSYQKFSRYTPVADGEWSHEFDFRISIFPEFSKGRKSGSTIPGLLYQQQENYFDPEILLSLRQSGYHYEFGAYIKLVLSSVVVETSTGEIFTLVEGKGKQYDMTINTFEGRITREKLGVITGDDIVIKAEGYVETKTGDKHKFTHSQNWRVSRSTRFQLSILGGGV